MDVELYDQEEDTRSLHTLLFISLFESHYMFLNSLIGMRIRREASMAFRLGSIICIYKSISFFTMWWRALNKGKFIMGFNTLPPFIVLCDPSTGNTTR
jgi:cytochrome c oxidase assembly factor CtaG